jgi:hypothetical protein
LLASSAPGCSQKETALKEASANFDMEDVAPFLKRLVALVDSGFTSADAEVLADRISKQALDSEREYKYPAGTKSGRTPMRIVVFMDDVDAPDIAFFTEPALADQINAAMAKYFEAVGK